MKNFISDFQNKIVLKESKVKYSKDNYPQDGILMVIEDVILSKANDEDDDFDKNRNNRKYTLELWENVLNSSDFKEAMENDVIFGELDHPSDGRFEVNPQLVSHKINNVRLDGKYVKGDVKILNTPTGRIAHTMFLSGSTLGVSSRGAGEYLEDGVTVNPDTFELSTWDLVLMPSVPEARVANSENESKYSKLVKESEDIAFLQDMHILAEAHKDKKLCSLIENNIKDLESKKKDVIKENKKVIMDLYKQIDDLKSKYESLKEGNQNKEVSKGINKVSIFDKDLRIVDNEEKEVFDEKPLDVKPNDISLESIIYIREMQDRLRANEAKISSYNTLIKEKEKMLNLLKDSFKSLEEEYKHLNSKYESLKEDKKKYEKSLDSKVESEVRSIQEAKDRELQEVKKSLEGIKKSFDFYKKFYDDYVSDRGFSLNEKKMTYSELKKYERELRLSKVGQVPEKVSIVEKDIESNLDVDSQEDLSSVERLLNKLLL